MSSSSLPYKFIPVGRGHVRSLAVVDADATPTPRNWAMSARGIVWCQTLRSSGLPKPSTTYRLLALEANKHPDGTKFAYNNGDSLDCRKENIVLVTRISKKLYPETVVKNLPGFYEAMARWEQLNDEHLEQVRLRIVFERSAAQGSQMTPERVRKLLNMYINELHYGPSTPGDPKGYAMHEVMEYCRADDGLNLEKFACPTGTTLRKILEGETLRLPDCDHLYLKIRDMLPGRERGGIAAQIIRQLDRCGVSEDAFLASRQERLDDKAFESVNAVHPEQELFRTKHLAQILHARQTAVIPASNVSISYRDGYVVKKDGKQVLDDSGKILRFPAHSDLVRWIRANTSIF